MAIGRPIEQTPNIADKVVTATATAGQTQFTVTGGYRVNHLAVFRNGVRLVNGNDFTALDGVTVTLMEDASNLDVLEFQVFDTFSVSDALLTNAASQTVNGDVTVNGAFTVGSGGIGTFTAATVVVGIVSSTTGITTIQSEVAAASTSTGALQVMGGVGIGKSLYVGGNVSVGGTLTYEDVTNVDSVGLVTAGKGVRITTGGLVVTAGVSTFAGITTVTNTAAFHSKQLNVSAGSTFGGAVTLSDDVTFTGASYNAYWDKSQNRLEFADNASLMLGTGEDLLLYTNGSNSFIDHSGDGDLKIRSLGSAEKIEILAAGDVNIKTASGAKDSIVCNDNEGVKLYFNNQSKFETTNDGTITTGIATVTGDANINGKPPWSADSSDAGVLSISGNNATTNGNIRLGNGAADTNADFDLGRIQFYNGATEVARIVGGTGDSNNDTGLLQFSTKSNGASIAERLRIDAAGRVLMGTTTEGNAGADDLTVATSGTTGITVRSGTSGNGNLYFSDGTSGDDEYRGSIQYQHANNDLVFAANAIEALWINSSGQVGVNTTNPGGKFGVAVDNSSTNVLATGGNIINLKNTNTTDNSWVSMDFNNSAGGIVGRFGAQFLDTSDKSTDLYFATRKDGGALTERLRITKDGEIRIGGNEGGYTTNIIRESSDTTTATTQLLLYSKHDGSGNTGVGFGGGIRFWGDRNGDNAEQNMGRIMCIADVNSGTNISGALVFETAAAGSLAERMRITSAGICSMRSAATTEFIQLTSTNNNTRAALSASGKDSSGNAVTLKIGGFGDTNRGEIFTHSNHGLGFATNNAATQMVLDTSGRLLVGHTSSHADLHGKIQLAGAASQSIDIARYTANAYPPYLNLFKSRNASVGGNTATLAGDNCGTISGYGNDGSGFHAVGSLQFECDEDSANDDMPGRFIVEITADGGTTLTERLRIDKNGTTWIQKAQVDTQFDTQAFIRCHPTSETNSGGRTIVFLGTDTDSNYGTAMCGYRRGTSGEPTWELRMLNDSITGTQVEEVRNSGYHAILSTESLLNMNTSQDGSGSDYFARGSKNSTTAGGGNDVFWIYEDGDMYNVNGTFSQSSDIKLKENVVDAPSQWNDLKALKVRKFNFKASTGLDTHTQIGMVAQEVESTCPGLIKERVDLQKTTNSDGTVTETDTGEKTKSIKLTVLYMKAVKALQEAMTRIETLETENTDLKTLIKNSSSFAALKASL